MTLDWKDIKPLNGGREKGFEELCAQLARAESPTGARFERKGAPDAGVECYAVLSDGSEWGWQAKYFHELGKTQWNQIDESVMTAIDKHPRLVRYFVCIPLDRPDARSKGRRSAKDRWDELVQKWTKQASAKGMTVEFVYWGSHELLERLQRAEHVGRVRFWFDVKGFDAAWFNSRLDEALKTAGPRYTPEVHVKLPIGLNFEAFGRTDRFFECQKAHARTIREKLKTLEYSEGAADATIDALVTSLSTKVQEVLTSLGAITAQPTGPFPFKAIAEQVQAAEDAAVELSHLLEEHEAIFDATCEKADADNPRFSNQRNPFRNRRNRLLALANELHAARASLIDADKIAGSSLMLLRGDAGTGKTHLLCDVARQRLAAGRPTVLLMGQRFVSNDAPWSQALQQLDIGSVSAEEFVGALEAAAQAAGSRALLVIDAINEGAGRTIWPSHLAAFLTHLERSPWIGVVLAIRSSYEGIIFPEGVPDRAVVVTHRGFAGHEYDAAKSFFDHYGLELPSTPLLAPEFRNPLFLKTLCQGLKGKGERRLPRGFEGITAVFERYLSEINKRLAVSLDFDVRTPLVRQAVEALAKAILDSGENWLTRSKTKEIVNALLPGRDFERSLYRSLVVEGVLVEYSPRHRGAMAEEFVVFAYERFSDQLVASALLDRHLDVHDPASAFAQSNPLAFIGDSKRFISPGLLEALCIQVPERTGKELISLAPTCAERWDFADAFRQSLIWRAYEAFSDGTRDALNELCRSQNDLRDTIDVLLTVAVLPGHPFNAKFLDQRLRKDVMADRDAWWSVCLHHAWGTCGAVDRLVDWASSLDANTLIDHEAIDLCAISLAWMFTTSNRFLRDRATKALVSLLTSRMAALVRLVERFADVDDPYVTERVYAVAYGVATRSHDHVAVGALASCVYSHVFATGSPPPHILLRDYARGVVERALHLGSAVEVEVDPDLVRPPYKSVWPTIPTDVEIMPLLPDWSKGSYYSGELEWGRNQIGSSVMYGDFARYVIGTNGSSTSREWLSLTLEEQQWKPPPSPEDQLHSLVGEFSYAERRAWEEFEAFENIYPEPSFSVVSNWEKIEALESLDRADLEALDQEPEKAGLSEVVELEEKRREVDAALHGVLTEEHARRLEEIRKAMDTNGGENLPPRFDLSQIQRYILKRVFDMGWTEERFGRFDRFTIGHDGREASKAERIGKKYQWIAYHEIMAFISDRFQYLEPIREEHGDRVYEGPWQGFLRDIDPSCTMSSLRGGTSWDGHAHAWWGFDRYDAWGNPSSPRDWVLKHDDLPKVEDLLLVTNPSDGSRWLNGYGYFKWIQRPPADLDSTDVELREVWYICTAYLVQADDAQSFLRWAEGVDFFGRWMPEPPEIDEMFLGEHAWAPASRYFQQQYYQDGGWTQPKQSCPVKIRTVAFEYLRGAGGFDCSVDESFTLRLPVSDLVNGLGIRWSGRGADFVDAVGRVAAQDPTVHADGPSALLLRGDLLMEYLARENLTICWAVLGEKRVLPRSPRLGNNHPALRISGAYALSGGRVIGFAKRMLDAPSEVRKDPYGGLDVIAVARSPF